MYKSTDNKYNEWEETYENRVTQSTKLGAPMKTGESKGR